VDEEAIGGTITPRVREGAAADDAGNGCSSGSVSVSVEEDSRPFGLDVVFHAVPPPGSSTRPFVFMADVAGILELASVTPSERFQVTPAEDEHTRLYFRILPSTDPTSLSVEEVYLRLRAQQCVRTSALITGLNDYGFNTTSMFENCQNQPLDVPYILCPTAAWNSTYLHATGQVIVPADSNCPSSFRQDDDLCYGGLCGMVVYFAAGSALLLFLVMVTWMFVAIKRRHRKDAAAFLEEEHARHEEEHAAMRSLTFKKSSTGFSHTGTHSETAPQEGAEPGLAEETFDSDEDDEKTYHVDVDQDHLGVDEVELDDEQPGSRQQSFREEDQWRNPQVFSAPSNKKRAPPPVPDANAQRFPVDRPSPKRPPPKAERIKDDSFVRKRVGGGFIQVKVKEPVDVDDSKEAEEWKNRYVV